MASNDPTSDAAAWRSELPRASAVDPVDWLLAASTATVGMGATPDTLRRAQYLDLIAYGQAPASAGDMARMSGCALVVRGLCALYAYAGGAVQRGLLADGVRGQAAAEAAAFVAAPYKPGTVLADLLAFATAADAVREPFAELPRGESLAPADALAEEGDVLCLGNPDHVCIVHRVEADGAGDVLVSSVDGGQRNGFGYECVLRRTRKFTYVAGAWLDEDDGRPVERVLSWPKLAAALRGES